MKISNSTIKISKTLLIILGLTAILTTAIVAPNVLQLIKYLQKKNKKIKHLNYQSIRSALYRLKKQKLITFQEKNNKTILEITEKGKKRILKYNIDDMGIKKPKKWDKKWRLVIFDIPNNKNIARDVLRAKLKEFGFYQMQKSVWIFPYDCKKEIDFIKEVYRIDQNIQYIIANKIENEPIYKKCFKLK